jgi:hypothetical protein
MRRVVAAVDEYIEGSTYHNHGSSNTVNVNLQMISTLKVAWSNNLSSLGNYSHVEKSG